MAAGDMIKCSTMLSKIVCGSNSAKTQNSHLSAGSARSGAPNGIPMREASQMWPRAVDLMLHHMLNEGSFQMPPLNGQIHIVGNGPLLRTRVTQRRFAQTHPDQLYFDGYFRAPDGTRVQAQVNKGHRIVRKLMITPGMRMLDIGCGVAQTFARRYRAKIFGITLSALHWVADMKAWRLHRSSALRHWPNRFEADQYKILALIDDRLLRICRFYFASCEQTFRPAVSPTRPSLHQSKISPR